MANNKQDEGKNNNVNPMAVGAAAIAGGVAGAAIATALSDKDTRKKITDKVMDLKDGAMNMIEEMKDQSQEVQEKSKAKIIKVRSQVADAVEPDEPKKKPASKKN